MLILSKVSRPIPMLSAGQTRHLELVVDLLTKL